MLDCMTIINPHLEGKIVTGTLPLTSEVLQLENVILGTWIRFHIVA